MFDALLTLLLLVSTSVSATTHYVWQSSPKPTPPYTTWASAATNIQYAVDAALVGDNILVTNGTYAPVTGNTPVTLQSVNGPGVTVIDGGGTARCLYLTNDAMIVGFTLTNGMADSGGGVYCESTSVMVSNCVLSGNSAWSSGGGAYGGALNNCTLTGNHTAHLSPWEDWGGGGGAASATFNNCALIGNSACSGGGASGGTLNNCALGGNTAHGGYVRDPFTGDGHPLSGVGGGAGFFCTLNNCIVSYNGASNSPN